MATGTVDPIFGQIAALLETIITSSAPRQELPPWYVSLRSILDSFVAQRSASFADNIRTLIPFLAAALGMTQEQISSVVDSVLNPRPRTTDPPPEDPPIDGPWTAEVEAEMTRRYPEAMAEYQRALAEEEGTGDPPPEKKARHD